MRVPALSASESTCPEVPVAVGKVHRTLDKSVSDALKPTEYKELKSRNLRVPARPVVVPTGLRVEMYG